jgi:hypothetical protein
MLTISDATAPGQPTSTSSDQPSVADELGMASKPCGEKWWARIAMAPGFEAFLDAFKVIGFGLFFVNVAVWAVLLPDLAVVLAVPLAVQGLGLICVGTVLLLPVGLHFSRSHTRVSLAGLGVFAIAFAAFAAYAFWPAAR